MIGSMLGPNRVIAKDVKTCIYCCYVRCGTLIVRLGVTHYHAQLGPPDKGQAIKEFVVCLMPDKENHTQGRIGFAIHQNNT